MKFDGAIARLEKDAEKRYPQTVAQLIFNAYAARQGFKPAKVKNASITRAIIQQYKLRKKAAKLQAKERKKQAGKAVQLPLVPTAVVLQPSPPPSKTVYVRYLPSFEEDNEHLLWDPFYRQIHRIHQINHIFYMVYDRQYAEQLHLTGYDSPKALYAATRAAKAGKVAI